MRADVADVRVRLEEAVLRTDALLATGQPERAAAVLDEQHALLVELQDTLASAVAAASVEAEAEVVLLGTPGGPELFGDPASSAPERRDEPRGRRRSRTSASASALVSAVAALAILVVAAPTPSPRTLAASDVDDVVRRTGEEPAGVEPTGRADGGTGTATPARIAGPNELELRRFFTSPAATDRRDAAGPANDVTFGLSELQALVDQFLATVVRAAGGLSADGPAEGAPVPAPRPPRSADLGGAGTPAATSGDPAATQPVPTEADAGADASTDPAEGPSLPPLPSSDAPAEDGATADDGATTDEGAAAEEPPAEEGPPGDDGTRTDDGGDGSAVPTLQ